MKILFVVEHFYPYVGGAEELFLNLTVSLAKSGHDVSVVTTLYNREVKKFEDYGGVKIYRVNCYNRFLFTFLGLPEIFRRAKGVDIIHTTSYNSAVPAFLTGFILSKKVVITFHEVWAKLWFKLPFTSKWNLTGFYLYEWFILKLPFYRYVAVSDHTRNSLIKNGVPESKIVKIYNGIDYTLFSDYLHQPPANFTFCFFGRLGISKGIDVLLDAAKQFFNNHPEAVLKLIIPTYPKNLLAKVLDMISDYGIERNIILMHNLSKKDLLKEVSNSSCVVIPSESEGFCYVAVESVAMGVPVISSGKGSLPEVVGGSHLILKELNAQSLFEALQKAARNEWDYKTPPGFLLADSVKSYLDLYLSMNGNLK